MLNVCEYKKNIQKLFEFFLKFIFVYDKKDGAAP